MPHQRHIFQSVLSCKETGRQLYPQIWLIHYNSSMLIDQNLEHLPLRWQVSSAAQAGCAASQLHQRPGLVVQMIPGYWQLLWSSNIWQCSWLYSASRMLTLAGGSSNLRSSHLSAPACRRTCLIYASSVGTVWGLALYGSRALMRKWK